MLLLYAINLVSSGTDSILSIEVILRSQSSVSRFVVSDIRLSVPLHSMIRFLNPQAFLGIHEMATEK